MDVTNRVLVTSFTFAPNDRDCLCRVQVTTVAFWHFPLLSSYRRPSGQRKIRRGPSVVGQKEKFLQPDEKSAKNPVNGQSCGKLEATCQYEDLVKPIKYTACITCIYYLLPKNVPRNSGKHRWSSRPSNYRYRIGLWCSIHILRALRRTEGCDLDIRVWWQFGSHHNKRNYNEGSVSCGLSLKLEMS